jgi:hypothetical protein
MRVNRDWWLDVGILLLLTAALMWPLFRLEYLNRWSSIEATFIADGRLLQANWPHHLWQPLWYCGTRASYVYPPGLSIALAVFASFLHLSPARGYHLSIGLFYLLGIVAVYLWTRAATRSRCAGWLAAAGVALVSPSLLILGDFRNDTPYFVPWRQHVLMMYGEGPHISSLAVLPLVWLGAWRQFRSGGVRWLVFSAVCAASVVTINFYGATALAITFTLLAWACFLEGLNWRIFRDAAAVGALSYALTAWWLAPSYLGITSRNLRLVAPAGNSWSIPLFAVMLLAYVAVSLWIRSRRWYRPYPFFILSSLGFLAVYILGYRWAGFQVAGNSLRLVPELELFVILCSVQFALLLWSLRVRPAFRLVPRIAMVLLLALCFRPSWRYLKHVYWEFPSDAGWRQRIEARAPAWLQQHFPEQRVFVTGTIRFWYNVWQDGQQADGGSDQGILNPLISAGKWRIIHDPDIQVVQDCLRTFGVDILVVPGPTSQEGYKDFPNPGMYAGRFPLLRDDGEGNRYYRIPRRATGIVRVVDRARMQAIPALPFDPGAAQLHAYAEAVESIPVGGASPDRARGHWRGSDMLDVDVDLQAHEALLVQETFDPYWRAIVDGHAIRISRDAAGFMLLDAPPGKHSIRFVFDTPIEVNAGRALTAGSLLLIGFLTLQRFVRAPHRRISPL